MVIAQESCGIMIAIATIEAPAAWMVTPAGCDLGCGGQEDVAMWSVACLARLRLGGIAPGAIGCLRPVWPE